jgi:hypothetical protein
MKSRKKSFSASGLRASNGFFRPTNGFLPAAFSSGCFERLFFKPEQRLSTAEQRL